MFSASIGREGLEITHSYYRAGLPPSYYYFYYWHMWGQPGSSFIVPECTATVKPKSLADLSGGLPLFTSAS
jgi:hypothetical protein